MFTTNEINVMDKVTRKFYEFLEACQELTKETGVTIKNHNTFVGNDNSEAIRNDLVRRFNNASKDVFGK